MYPEEKYENKDKIKNHFSRFLKNVNDLTL